MALIDSWVIYKALCKSSISYRAYIQKVSEELTGSLNCAMESLPFESPTRFNTASSDPLNHGCTCSGKWCQNRTTDICMVCMSVPCMSMVCQSPICGKCCRKQCLSCL